MTLKEEIKEIIKEDEKELCKSPLKSWTKTE